MVISPKFSEAKESSFDGLALILVGVTILLIGMMGVICAHPVPGPGEARGLQSVFPPVLLWTMATAGSATLLSGLYVLFAPAIECLSFGHGNNRKAS